MAVRNKAYCHAFAVTAQWLLGTYRLHVQKYQATNHLLVWFAIYASEWYRFGSNEMVLGRYRAVELKLI